ncbi:IS66 family transposase, partial [Thiolapillus sp.]|uniref:IS66 family transposase n=1 Tax=Thiolapillus sp. TaxID=2017437 RepID=UPI003AF569FF
MTGRRVRRPTLFSLWRKARRENSAASRLLGSTSLRFALHGWQRTKVSKADVAIGKIRKLYAIEKRIEALPVLNDLKAWLEKNRTRVPKDSLTYKAMQYTLNQWELLT